jgi:hypothetical protein
VTDKEKNVSKNRKDVPQVKEPVIIVARCPAPSLGGRNHHGVKLTDGPTKEHWYWRLRAPSGVCPIWSPRTWETSGEAWTDAEHVRGLMAKAEIVEEK